MEKFSVKDLALNYRVSLTGSIVSQFPDRGLEYSTPPMENTYTKYADISVEGYAYNDDVDYEGLLENPEDNCFETTELVGMSLKIIDLKQLGKPMAYTEDELGCGSVLERGFKLDLTHLREAMDCASREDLSMFDSFISIISNTEIKTPISIYGKGIDDNGTTVYQGYIPQDIWDFRNPIIAFVEDVHIQESFKNKGILTEVFKQLKVVLSRNFNYDMVMLVGCTDTLDGRKYSNVSNSYIKKTLTSAFNSSVYENGKGALYFNILGSRDTWVLNTKAENAADSFETVHFVVSFGDDIDFDCDYHHEETKSHCSGKCNEGCKGCCVTGTHTDIYRSSDDIEIIGTDFEKRLYDKEYDCDNCNKCDGCDE